MKTAKFKLKLIVVTTKNTDYVPPIWEVISIKFNTHQTYKNTNDEMD